MGVRVGTAMQVVAEEVSASCDRRNPQITNAKNGTLTPKSDLEAFIPIVRFGILALLDSCR